MADKFVRIGSLDNIHVFDDGDFDGGIETDDCIKAGQAPTANIDVLRLVDVGVIIGNVIGPAASTNNAVARFDGVSGKLLKNSVVIVNDAGSIDIPTGQDYRVNSIQVVTDQQAVEANAAALSAFSLPAGADTVDRINFNTDIAIMIGEINDIKDTLNSLLAKLRTHGLIDT